MKIVGVDVGRANTGIIIYDFNKKRIEHAGTISLPIQKMRNEEKMNPKAWRLMTMYGKMCEILGRWAGREGGLAVIEDYAYGDVNITLEQFRKMDKMALEVGESHGVCYAALATWRIPFIKVAPTQLKLFITGNGSCEKPEIMKVLQPMYEDKIDCDLKDDHQYDALGLAHMGRYYVTFCKNSSVFTEGTYEYSVMVELAYKSEHRNITNWISKLNLKQKVKIRL